MAQLTLKEFDYILTGKEVCYCAGLTKAILKNWILYDKLPSETYSYDDDPLHYDNLDIETLQYKAGNVYNALKQEDVRSDILNEFVENVRALYDFPEKAKSTTQPPHTPPTPPPSEQEETSKKTIRIQTQTYALLGTAQEQINALREQGITHNAILAKVICKPNDKTGFGLLEVGRTLFPNDACDDRDIRKKVNTLLKNADEFNIIYE